MCGGPSRSRCGDARKASGAFLWTPGPRDARSHSSDAARQAANDGEDGEQQQQRLDCCWCCFGHDDDDALDLDLFSASSPTEPAPRRRLRLCRPRRPRRRRRHRRDHPPAPVPSRPGPRGGRLEARGPLHSFHGRPSALAREGPAAPLRRRRHRQVGVRRGGHVPRPDHQRELLFLLILLKRPPPAFFFLRSFCRVFFFGERGKYLLFSFSFSLGFSPANTHTKKTIIV